MNNKPIYILLGILGLVLGLILLVQLTGKAPSDGVEYLLPSLRPRAGVKPPVISVVEIEHTKDGDPKKLTFERTETGWRLKEPFSRVDGTMVDRLIDQIRNAHKEEADLPSNLKDIGLDPPSLIIMLTPKEGREIRVNIGGQSAGKETAVVYVNSSEVSEPMAVRRNNLDHVFKELTDFIPPELVKADVLRTTFAQLEAPNQPVIALEMRKDSRWFYVKPAGYGEADPDGEPPPENALPNQEQPITGVKYLVNAIGAIKVHPRGDIITFNASEDELARYGLKRDQAATLRIEIKHPVESLSPNPSDRQIVSEALLVGKKLDPKADEEKVERYYARLEDEKIVYQVEAKALASILAVLPKPEVFRDRDLTHLELSKTDALDVKNAEGTVRLRHFGEPIAWHVYGLSSAGEGDSEVVRDLLKTLNQRRQIKEFPPDKPDAEYGFDKPSVEIRTWANALVNADKKDSKSNPPPEPKLENDPVIELIFGKTDKDLVYVKRKTKEETRILAVPSTMLAMVSRSPVAYLTRRLPSFLRTDAVKIELKREGNTYTLENQEKEGWQLKTKEGSEKPDGDAVIDILEGLSHLHPTKLVAEKISDKDDYGLKNPLIQATVSFREKDKKPPMSYLIGKETEDKKGVYAKQGERDLVFVIDSEILKPLQADLRDRKVFSFDPAKVREIHFTGWQKLGKGKQILQIRKTDKGWEAKDFPLNEMVNDLLEAKLARLKPERFVVRNGEIKPAFRLDEANRSLLIDIFVQGLGEPLYLIIGGLDEKGEAYFAQASTKPRDVFLLPKKSYQDLLDEGPSYFKKPEPKVEPKK